jgi:glucose/mannose-6-phosphate isomerase
MSPRAATGYLFTPLAMILAGLEIIPDPIKDIRETITILKTIREESHPGVETEKNQARQIAKVMNGQLPIIWGSSGNTETAAMRWKTQINENAKCPAYFNVFPELNHNEIVGFDVPDELLTRQVVVILKDADDHPQIAKRMAISESIISSRIRQVIKIDSRGQSWLARFYSLVYLGDYVSYYLALEYGVNPTPVKVIDYLKAELAKEV